MSSPSAALKVNYLIIRYLYFRSVRGDLQEGHFALPDANPYRFEHKIGVFVSEWAVFPRFSGLPST